MSNKFVKEKSSGNNVMPSTSANYRKPTSVKAPQTKPLLKIFEVQAVNSNLNKQPVHNVKQQMSPDLQLQGLKTSIPELTELLANSNLSKNVPVLIHKITKLSGHSNLTLKKMHTNAFSYHRPRTHPCSTDESKPKQTVPKNHVNKNVTKCFKCRKNAGIIHLSCQHVFCGYCLIKPISDVANAFCPFQNGNYRCANKLEVDDLLFVMKAIKTSLGEPCTNDTNTAPVPKRNIIDHRPVANKIKDELFVYSCDENSNEIIFHCKQDKCGGFWFVDKTDGKRTYQCPVCDTYNNYSNGDALNQPVSSEAAWKCENCKYTDNIIEATVCVVCSRNRNMKTTKSTETEYYRLLQLEDNDNFLPNFDEFECIICTEIIEPANGVLLRSCFHNFCRICIRQYIENQDQPEIKCPNHDCNNILEDREIKTLISSQAYDRYLQISLRVGKTLIKNGYQCCVANCQGWWVFTEGIYSYICTVCQTENCIACKATHPGIDCKTYQLNLFYSTDQNGIETRQRLELMLKTGEAEHCPKCNIIVVKNGGCPQMHCSMCRTNFVWGQMTNKNLNIK